jgi:hypothetical protein
VVLSAVVILFKLCRISWYPTPALLTAFCSLNVRFLLFVVKENVIFGLIHHMRMYAAALVPVPIGSFVIWSKSQQDDLESVIFKVHVTSAEVIFLCYQTAKLNLY